MLCGDGGVEMEVGVCGGVRSESGVVVGWCLGRIGVYDGLCCCGYVGCL